MKIIQVCKSNCDHKPFQVKVGRKIHTFCCEKGYRESVKQFSKTLKPKGGRAMMHNNNKRHSHHESKKTIEKRNKNIYRKHERESNNTPAEDDAQLCDICGEYIGSRAFPVYNERTGERVPGLFQCAKCITNHPDD